MVGRRVVDVGGDPDDVADAAASRDEAQQLGDLQLAPEGRAGIAVGHRLEVARARRSTTSPIGMSQAMTFQVARDAPGARSFSQRSCARAEDRVSRRRAAAWRFGEFGPAVRCAGRARTRRATARRRATGRSASGPRPARRIGGTRGTRASRARRQQRHVLHRVARVVVHLARVPVVQHLVVVPLHDPRHLGVEARGVLVEQVVEVVAAELVEGLRHLRLRRRDEVAPHRAVVERRPRAASGLSA